jgi:hypothetical protein
MGRPPGAKDRREAASLEAPARDQRTANRHSLAVQLPRLDLGPILRLVAIRTPGQLRGDVLARLMDLAVDVLPRPRVWRVEDRRVGARRRRAQRNTHRLAACAGGRVRFSPAENGAGRTQRAGAAIVAGAHLQPQPSPTTKKIAAIGRSPLFSAGRATNSSYPRRGYSPDQREISRAGVTLARPCSTPPACLSPPWWTAAPRHRAAHAGPRRAPRRGQHQHAAGARRASS